MERDEVIEGLYQIKNWKCNGNAEMHEVIASAIRLLEQSDTTSDSISRQAALNCVTYDVEYTTERIKALPSLQPTCNQLATDCISKQAAIEVLEEYEKRIETSEQLWTIRGCKDEILKLPLAQPEPQTARVFQEIIVEHPSISIYPEYEGKPYFSIKYMEDGHGFIGYGTYKPEVLSEYLIKYFMPSAQPQKCSDILDELKDDDYYNYIHTGHSRFSEDDWDYLIYNAKEKEELHERLDIKTGSD